MAQTIQFEGQQHSFPDDFSPSDISTALASVPPAPSMAADVAKSGGIGLAKGAIGLAGLPGDLSTMLNKGIDSAENFVRNKIGADPLPQQDYANPLGSANIQNKVEGVTGKFYEPQTTPGKYAQTIGEFAPAVIGGPEGLATRLLTRAAIPGAASEAAGEATEGTPLEPYARIGAGLVGGAAGARASAPAAAKLLPQNVIDAGSAAYKSPEVLAVQIKPQAAQTISDNIVGDLNKSRLNARLAPQTHAIVEDLAVPVNGPNHSLEDFQTVRTLLGKQAGNFSNPTEQAAASKAIDLLDKHVASMPQTDLLAGDIAKANETLTAGRGDYAAGKAAERVQGKLDNAELQASSAHSGGNIDNATRQKLRTLLTSKAGSRGFTPEELDQIDQVVRGSPTGNALRAVGKVLGGGGGLGSVVSAAEGMHVAGPVGAAAPLLGYAVKRAGDAMTARAADRAVQQILSRAPSAPALLPNVPASRSPVAGGLIGALLASTSQRPPLMSLPLAGVQPQSQQDRQPASQ